MASETQSTIPSIAVSLTERQEAAFASMVDQAHAAAAEGRPGMQLAQVFGSHMRVFFINYEQACGFQEVMGQQVGRTTKDPAPVACPVPVA